MDRSSHLRKLWKKFWDALNDRYARVARRIEVGNEDYVYRRVHPDQIENGAFSSAAFNDPEMSVDIASLTSEQKSYQRSHSERYGLVKIRVQDLRQLSIPQQVNHWPAILNYAHGLVIGKKTQSIRKRIKEKAEWVIKPGSDDKTSTAAPTAGV